MDGGGGDGGGDASSTPDGGYASTDSAPQDSGQELTTTGGTVGMYGVPLVYGGARKVMGGHRCEMRGRCRVCDFSSGVSSASR